MSKHAGPVVHVIGELARAGAELFVCRLASALSRQGQPVEIWVLYPAECIHADRPTALQDEKELRAELEQAGLTVRFLDKRPRRDYLSTWRRLRAWLGWCVPSSSTHIWKRSLFMSGWL